MESSGDEGIDAGKGRQEEAAGAEITVVWATGLAEPEPAAMSRTLCSHECVN